MKIPFFSIIIPVYNTEAYIERCLKSCIEQTFENIEIIVIDDCGSDNAIKIAQRFAKQDLRITIIYNTQNSGVYKTRIIGSKKAQGEYIIYLDSDDFVDTKMCQELYEEIQNYNKKQGGGVEELDILGFSSQITPEPNKGNKFITSPLGAYQSPKLIESLMWYWMIWNKTYRRNLITQVIDFLEKNFKKLPRINMAEDALKFFIICLFAKNYLGIDKTLHFYYNNTQSITRDLKNLRRHRIAIEGFSQVLFVLRKIKTLYPNISKQADALIETLSNHRRETRYSYWITHALTNQRYIKNLKMAISATRSPKKKLIAYRKIAIHLITFGIIKS